MDNEILSALAYFQEEIEELSMKFQKLKDVTYNLYKENRALEEENRELKALVFNREVKGDAYTNLSGLYNEGYHICHLSFGEKRKGDCLFCQQLLEGKMGEE
ncbi:MAG: initiation control protein YabA [Halanaerobiales bacterium]